MAATTDGPRPLLVAGDAAAGAIAARLSEQLLGLAPERIAAGAEHGGVLQALDARRPCIYIGPVEPLILALASALPGRGPGGWAPLVAVTPDGGAVIPLLGETRGGKRLAEAVARALGLAPRAAAAETGEPRAAAADERTAPPPGRLAVVGLGPDAAALMAPAVREELDRAEDIVGYTTYVRMAGPFRPEQRILDSDNRREMDRARLAFSLAARGRRVVVVSSGDPGVFGMAAAVVDALGQAEDRSWLDVELVVLPGVSAAQATAARVGAPLGHDFCVLSLSDNLKPWAQIERRLEHAAAADLVIALYNPRSRARPWQLGSALALLARHRAPETPVVLGRDVGWPAEQVLATTLGEMQPEQVDMRTVVIVGSSRTRQFPRRDGGTWVYTPRWYPDASPATGEAAAPSAGR